MARLGWPVAAILLGGLLIAWSIAEPRPAGLDASPTYFSSDRAMADVSGIAAAARPAGFAIVGILRFAG